MKSLSRFHVIALNLALVALPFAIYFLIYVDAQRARIATREFQALHDVGSEFSWQLKSLGGMVGWSSLAPEKVSELRRTRVYRDLFLKEDQRCRKTADRDLAALGVEQERAGAMVTILTPRKEWDSKNHEVVTKKAKGMRCGRGEVAVKVGVARIPLAALVSNERALEFFDDLLIADGDGRVLYRRGTGAVHLEGVGDLSARVRVARASQAAEGSDEKSAGPGQAPRPLRSGASGEPFMEKLALGDVEYWVFGQPLRPPIRWSAAGNGEASEPWTILGLARVGRFNEEVMVVRKVVLAAVVAGLLFGMLSWPWLKLGLIGSRERLRVIDAELAGLGLLLGAMLATVCLMSTVSHRVAKDQLDELQEKLGKKIQIRLTREVAEARLALDDLERALWHDPSSPRPADDVAPAEISLHRLDEHGRPTRAYPRFELGFVADVRGRVYDRISRRRMPLGTMWVGDRDYFWKAKAGGTKVVERVRGVETGEKVTIFARKVGDTGGDAPPTGDAERIVALSRVLLTLQDAALPQGFGFAVVERATGYVQFHSDDKRSLLENLISATNHERGVKPAIADYRKRFVDVEYDGRPHRMLFPEEDARAREWPDWRVVVFREAALLDDLTFETLLTTGAGLALYVLLVVGAGAAARRALGREIFWGWVWPQPGLEWRCAGLAAVFAALTAIMVLGIGEIVGRVEAPFYDTLALLLAPPLFALSLGFIVLAPQEGSEPGRAVAVSALAIASAGLAWVLSSLDGLRPGVLLAVLAFGALSIPRGSDTGRRLGRGPLFAVVLLGLVVTAVLPAAILFRDAQILEIDSLRAQEMGHEEARVMMRESALLAHRARLTDSSGTLAEATEIQETKDFTRGLFVPATGGSGELAGGVQAGMRAREEWHRWRLTCLLREPLPGMNRVQSKVATSERSETNPLRSAEWMTAESWWWPKSAGERLSLIFAVLATVGAGGALTLSAGRRILGLGVPDGEPRRGNHDAKRWVQDWVKDAQGSSIRCQLLVTPSPSFLERLRDELVGHFGPHGLAWIELPLPAHERSEPEAALARRRCSEEVVVVENLEVAMLDPALRKALLSFLEDAVFREHLPVLLVSAALPLRQLVLTEVPGAARPDPDELLRWSRLLSSFRKQPLASAPEKARLELLGHEALRRECRESEELLEIALALEAEGTFGNASDAELIEALADRAEAHYQTLWQLCTFDERLVLIHLAQGHLANPRNGDVIEQLLRRGLVKRAPSLQLMNRSFARFALRAEPPEVVEKWEHESRQSLWLALRSSFLVALALGGVFVAYLGLETLNPVLTLVPVFAGALPTVTRFASALSGGRADAPPTGVG